ncbi:unnamed protein product [Hymenolepis diminuta]|uniref:Uncharacterized protein n=1 Tax=Hymenolepis diminuta TaxID=6216 RepID=A0A564XY39_HYMDI|nr:unnamed protein product [Hymenolepis diminuta]
MTVKRLQANVHVRNLEFWRKVRCHLCHGDLQIRTKWSVKNHPELNHIGLNWLDELKLSKKRERVIQTTERKAQNKSNKKYPKKRKQRPELNPTVSTGVKLELQVNYVKHLENGGLPSKSEVNAKCSPRHLEQNPPVKEMRKVEVKRKEERE